VPPLLILPIMDDATLPASSLSSRRRFLDAFCIASLDASLHDVTTSTSNGGRGGGDDDDDDDDDDAPAAAADDGVRDM
jgi:hypothetical protein